MEFSNCSVFNVEYLIAKIAEGRTVQYRHYKDESWKNYSPGNHPMPFSISNPDTWNTIVWRVKPETKNIKYRVLLCRDQFGNCYTVAQKDNDPPYINIVKVLEDWKEIEYEVE